MFPRVLASASTPPVTVIPATASEGVLDYRSTEFLLLALGLVMTVVALAVGIWLFRAALREHRAQLEAEQIEAERMEAERRERVAREAAARAESERGA